MIIKTLFNKVYDIQKVLASDYSTSKKKLILIRCILASNQTQLNELKKINNKLLQKLILNYEKQIDPIAFPEHIIANKQVKVLDVTRNVEHVLNVHHVTCRLNLMTFAPEFKYNLYKKINESYEKGDTSIVNIKNICVREGLNRNHIEEHVSLIAMENSFHPVRDWLDALDPWDNVDRLQDVYNTLILEDLKNSKFYHMLIRKWLILCVAAIYSKKGIAAQGVLTLSGPQYAGKTSWIKSLVPNLDWLGSEKRLDLNDKDTKIAFRSRWIYELSEFEHILESNASGELKKFITSDEDEIRPVYGKNSVKFPRRTCIFGTLDKQQVLVEAENRRFWMMRVSKCNHTHGINLNQLWAQLLFMYKRGDRYALTDEQVVKLQETNEAFKETSVVVEAVLSWGLVHPQDHDSMLTEDFAVRWMNCSHILRDAGINCASQKQTRELAIYLRLKKFDTNSRGEYKIGIEYKSKDDAPRNSKYVLTEEEEQQEKERYSKKGTVKDYSWERTSEVPKGSCSILVDSKDKYSSMKPVVFKGI